MISEGKIPFKVGNETYQTWYKLYGDLKTSEHRPVVALHGGPGMSHHYMLYVGSQHWMAIHNLQPNFVQAKQNPLREGWV